MDDVAEFLAAHPPFGQLSPDVLRRVVGAVRPVKFRRGEAILSLGGPPAAGLYIVRNGVVELLDGGLVVDSLGRGEAFGFPSMLTEEGPSYDVRAADDTECLLLPRDVAEDVLGSPSGLRFLARNLRARVRSAPTRASSVVLTSVPARALVGGPVVVREASTPIAEVARAMTEADVTAAVVRPRRPDRDRDRLGHPGARRGGGPVAQRPDRRRRLVPDPCRRRRGAGQRCPGRDGRRGHRPRPRPRCRR